MQNIFLMFQLRLLVANVSEYVENKCGAKVVNDQKT